MCLMSELLCAAFTSLTHKTSNPLCICKDVLCLNLDISFMLKVLCVQVSLENLNPFEDDTFTRSIKLSLPTIKTTSNNENFGPVMTLSIYMNHFR